jgi:biopolymer transport protein ExbB/TolQ
MADTAELLHEKVKLVGGIALEAFTLAKEALDTLNIVSLQAFALELALLKAGVVSRQNLDEAIAELRASRSVEYALNPEIQAAEAEMRRLADELRDLREKEE